MFTHFELFRVRQYWQGFNPLVSPVKKDVRILYVEDVPADVAIVNHELRKAGLTFRTKRVDTKKAFLEELSEHPPDLILSDHGLPCFDGFTALSLAKQRCPEVPFIFVTNSLGEEMAIKTFESGATDYVLKNDLSKLMPAIQRAMQGTPKAHREEASPLRALVDGIKDYAIIMLDRKGRITEWNEGAKRIHGYDAKEVQGQPFSKLFPPQSVELGEAEMALEAAEAKGRLEEDRRLVAKDEHSFQANMVITVLRDAKKKLSGFAVVTRPVAEPVAISRALPSSEERYRRLVDLCPCALLVVNDHGEIVFCNTAAVKLLGATTVDHLLSFTFNDIAPPPNGRTILEKIRHAREQGPPFIEHELVRLDGKKVFVQMSAVPFIFQGTPALQVIGYDVTRRKQVEDALRESEARKASILETALDAIISIDKEGLVQEWNPAAQRIFGYKRAQAMGKPVDALIVPPSLRMIYKEGLTHYLLTGAGSLVGRPIELTLRRADASEFRAELAISRLTGPVFRCIALIRDITERKRVEAALRESEERFRLLVEGVKDYAIYILDADGRVATWNSGAERLEGYRSEEIIGKPYAVFFLPEDVEKRVPEETLKQAVIEGQVHNEGWRVRKDGSHYWSLGVITALRDEAGVLHGYAKIAHDTTQRKEAEDKVLQLNATLEQRVAERTSQLKVANDELEAFSYSVSHDLRAPLRHIAGYVEILQSDAASRLKKEDQEHLDTIADSARRMSDLIDSLLAFSRMGRAEMHREEVLLKTVVEDARRQLKHEIGDRKVQWKIGTLPRVQGDKVMLLQAVVNLFSNALKYTRTRDPAIIEVDTKTEGNEIVFSVQDNGVGFDMGYADKLFGVFQRLHRADEFEGTGIGLANVRRIIHRHGGRTWAESSEGKGAKFYFSLPKSRKERNEETKMDPAG